ncbi:MAG: ankyrin repeat domain-containing protein [Bacteroidales bacterium]|nr:ankyrin repeat domain-containing protein [Bacteroidales bacterium]
MGPYGPFFVSFCQNYPALKNSGTYLSTGLFVLLIWLPHIRSVCQENDSVPKAELNYRLLVAAESDSINRVKKYLIQGADVDAKSWNGVTPLMYASQNGNLDMVNLLLGYDADVNIVPDNGINALLGAVLNGNTYIADTLIQHKADPDSHDYFNITPLMYASALGNYTMTDMLLFYGAKTITKDIHGNNALMFAVIYGNSEIAGLLLENGANINSKDSKGFSQLMITIQQGNYEIVSDLIAGGANIDHKNDAGFTSLAIAISGGNIDLVDLLISNGANINEDLNGRSYTDIARSTGNRNMLQKMKEYKLSGSKFPGFRSFFIGSVSQINKDDFLTGLQLGLSDPNYLTDIGVGYSVRPWARKALIKKENNYFYQFWEYRHFINIALHKNWILRWMGQNQNVGFVAGLRGSYSFGNFRGTNWNPEDFFSIIPEAGLFYTIKPVCLKVGYEFFNLKNEYLTNHWINLSVIVKFESKKNKIRLKKIPEIL